MYVLNVKVISLPIYFPGFVCFLLYWAKISGERLQDHWSSGYAPNFEKVDGAYCFWSVGAWVTLFVPTVTFKPLKLES